MDWRLEVKTHLRLSLDLDLRVGIENGLKMASVMAQQCIPRKPDLAMGVGSS